MSGPLAIHLLGAPFVARGSVRQPAPRGRKPWAMLVYLLVTDSAPSRGWLAECLFADADDPLSAVRWNLSELRRLLGSGAEIGGEPVHLRLPHGTYVDINVLTAGSWLQALAVPGLGHDLLEGMAFPGSAAFEVWLTTERRRLAGATASVLREAARSKLATGDPMRAAELATRLVVANPLDEDAQELLIRAYATGGDRQAAERARDTCVALFRRELGIDPGEAVLRAADPAPHVHPLPARPAATASVLAQLEAGLTTLDAGAADAAIESLRQAVAGADEAGDPHLRARASLALGTALVHGVRGRDAEGAAALHQAIEAAQQCDAVAVSAHAHRELGYVELLRGRYERALHWLQTAASLAADEPAEQAWAHVFHGIVLSDTGRHADGRTELREGLRLAEVAGDERISAWGLTFLGRSHLLCGELGDAREALQTALELARRLRWTALIPLPEALLADVDLAEGRIDAAAASYEHAYALALQLGDPCWEGIAGRGLGLVADRRGDVQTALTRVSEARVRCVRLPDAWLWVEGYCLDALCGLGLKHGQPDVARWIADLEGLATRTGMRELVARAYVHRSRLGDPTAANAARVLAAEVDNPTILTPDSPRAMLDGPTQAH